MPCRWMRCSVPPTSTVDQLQFCLWAAIEDESGELHRCKRSYCKVAVLAHGISLHTRFELDRTIFSSSGAKGGSRIREKRHICASVQ